MKFLGKTELELVNGGYLVEKGTTIPVHHPEFVKLQTEAHYLVNLAKEVKNVDFTKKEVPTFESIVKKVTSSLNDEKRTFVAKPAEVKTPKIDALQNEALAWIKGEKESTKTDKLNRILQKFEIIAEYEEFGLYFSEAEIVKLKQLYSLEEIVKAVTILEPHLD